MSIPSAVFADARETTFHLVSIQLAILTIEASDCTAIDNTHCRGFCMFHALVYLSIHT